ncbi:MAG: hypothetical protein ABSB74_09555 [Tepidisphaeraceae bacterium]
MSFQFREYIGEELQACGEEFRKQFINQEYENNDRWTLEVFNWFTATKAGEGCVYPHIGRKGEFLVDYCHTSYPLKRADEGWPSIAWWKRAISGQCGLLLALESEWGKWGNRDLSHVMILDDACKLAAIRARAKAMIFSSQGGQDRGEILDLLASLRSASRDDSPWLWIDIPWEKVRPRNIGCGVLG